MMKPITGQYECAHTSGVGLDYFTSRIDRLILQGNGRFTLVTQNKSRAANAAQSLISGQQVTNAAPESRREGHYMQNNTALTLNFDDGTQDQVQLSWNGEGIQYGPNFFTKVSDSTLLPPTHRMQKDMDDIAKGLKIASTLGGFALKAAKGIQSTIQATQGPGIGPDPVPQQQATPPQQAYQPPQAASPPQQAHPQQAASPQQAYQPPQQAAPQAAPTGNPQAVFCDQCGARARPGKRFCGNCGAQLF